jgi:hypothetical protein
MDLTEFLTLITIVWTLFKILTDAPKALENARKGWKFVRQWFSYIKKPSCINILIQNIDKNEAQEKFPTPPVQYTVIVPLTGTLGATGGRLILSAPPPLRINVFDTVSLGGTATGSI